MDREAVRAEAANVSMSGAQGSGSGIPPNLRRPRNRPIREQPPPPLPGRGNNGDEPDGEPQPEVRRFVGRIGPPTSRRGPVQVTDLREVDHFTNDNNEGNRPVPPRSGGCGRGRRASTISNNPFGYHAPLEAAEIQNRIIHDQDAPYVSMEEDTGHVDYVEGRIRIVEGVRGPDLTRQRTCNTRRLDGAGDPPSPPSRLWPTRHAGRRRGVETQRARAHGTWSNTSSRHQRLGRSNNLGARLRQQEASYYQSRFTEHFDLPPLPPPPPNDPSLPDRLDLTPPLRSSYLDEGEISQLERELAQATRRRGVRRLAARGRAHRQEPYGLEELPPYDPDELYGDAATISDILSSAELSPDPLPPYSPPRSWTNGRPLQHSMDGFDDLDLRQAQSYGLPRSMAFPSREPSPIDLRERSILDPPDPFFRRPVPLANAFGQGGLGASFNNNVPRRRGTSSEAEDIARESRGGTFEFFAGCEFYSEAAFD